MMGNDIVSVAQCAIEIITGFVAVAAIFVAFLAFLNFKSAEAPKKELKRLRKEFAVLKGEFEALKKDIEGVTFLSLGPVMKDSESDKPKDKKNAGA